MNGFHKAALGGLAGGMVYLALAGDWADYLCLLFISMLLVIGHVRDR